MTSGSKAPTTPTWSSPCHSPRSSADDFDARVAYMRGRLKAAGHTGALFDLLKSGDVDRALSALASRP
ncbi:MAG: hypothetical protein WKF58_16960 [Ilumatobacteraceae bacterium]